MRRLLCLAALSSRALGFSAPAPRTQYFLDSADVDAYAAWLPTGAFHGVTTNPTILARAGMPCDFDSVRMLHDVAVNKHGVKSFMAQAWGTDASALRRCGETLAAMSRYSHDGGTMVVKFPFTRDGVEAAARFGKESPVQQFTNVKICFTACFAAHQVLTACALGAEYVAPYLGRLSDDGQDALELVAKMQGIATQQSRGEAKETRVLVASIRHANHMAELAARGCDTFTFGPEVAAQLFGNSMTEAATAVFEKVARGPERTPKSVVPDLQPNPLNTGEVQLSEALLSRIPQTEPPPAAAPTMSGAPPRGLSRSHAAIENEEFFDETLEELGGEAWFRDGDDSPSPTSRATSGTTGKAPQPSAKDNEPWPEELDSVPEDEP